MTLRPCPECTTQVSEFAASCPKCGHPIASNSQAQRQPPIAPQPVVQDIAKPKSSGFGCVAIVLLICVVGLLFLQTGIGGLLFNVGRSAVDSQRIIGKWESSEGNYLEFFRDGTVREGRMLGMSTADGTYSLKPGSKIELNLAGLLWGKNEVVLNYQIKDDSLLLSAENGGLSFRYDKAR